MDRDRRLAEIESLTSYWGHGSLEALAEFERLIKHDDGSDLYTVPGLMQFVRFLVDVSKQTSVNEYQVFPACLVAMTADAVSRAAEEGRSSSEIDAFVLALSQAVAMRTRAADKAARFEHTWVVLLTRTVAFSVRDNYVPRISEEYQRAAREYGMPCTFNFGIASLTEHIIRDPEDMLQKALRALQAAERREPDAVRRGAATAACYDFRSMALV